MHNSIAPRALMFVPCSLHRTSLSIVLLKIEIASSLTTFQISFQVYWAMKWNSCHFTLLGSVFNSSSSNWLSSLQKYAHLLFKVQFLLIPPHGIFNGITDCAHANFSSILSVSFWIHRFAQRRQTQVNAQKLYILSPFAQLSFSLARLPGSGRRAATFRRFQRRDLATCKNRIFERLLCFPKSPQGFTKGKSAKHQRNWSVLKL